MLFLELWLEAASVVAEMPRLLLRAPKLQHIETSIHPQLFEMGGPARKHASALVEDEALSPTEKIQAWVGTAA
jgi:hypothetical protein